MFMSYQRAAMEFSTSTMVDTNHYLMEPDPTQEYEVKKPLNPQSWKNPKGIHYNQKKAFVKK